MREMILNDASGNASNTNTWSVIEANQALIDLAQGMAVLVADMKVPKTLRLQRAMQDIPIAQSASLLQMLFQLQRTGGAREEASFWLSLAQKMPLLTDLPDASVARFFGSEADSNLGASAQALMLCVHQSGIAVSFPSTIQWDADSLLIPFTELLDDGSIECASERIDNLARSIHASAIVGRHQLQTFADLNPASFWQKRTQAFPALGFGLDVEAQIQSVGGNQFWTIMRRLADLNGSAAAWDSGPAPDWMTKVSPESAQLVGNEKRCATRKFRNWQGVSCLYEWHARYGGSGRIHFRFDAADRSVEIGYIGPHLPL